MRSEPINSSKTAQDLRLLLLGDSIANGGWWTDQDKTISSLLEQFLIKQNLGFNQVEVLNASANSWGVRNQLAYLQKYGTFSIDILILLLNTDDLFSSAPSPLNVGRSLSYPDKKPTFALQEFFQKVLPSSTHPDLKNLPQEKGDIVQFNLDALVKINDIANKNKINFVVALTPLKREVLPPYSKDYELKARERLKNIIEEYDIEYIDFLPVFKEENNPESLYHDHIHLNGKGNDFVTKNIALTIVNGAPQIK
jgi:lysophospholipase L1-like esterase